MKDIGSLVGGMRGLQSRLLFHRGNAQYRETVEPLYLEHLEELRAYPDQWYFRYFMDWYKDYTIMYPRKEENK